MSEISEAKDTSIVYALDDPKSWENVFTGVIHFQYG